MNQDFKNAYYNISDNIVELENLGVSEEFIEETQKLREQLQKMRKMYEETISENWD